MIFSLKQTTNNWSRFATFLLIVLSCQTSFGQSNILKLDVQTTPITQVNDCSGSALVEYKLTLRNTSSTLSIQDLQIIFGQSVQIGTFVTGSLRYLDSQSNPTTAPGLNTNFRALAGATNFQLLTVGSTPSQGSTGLLGPNQKIVYTFRIRFPFNTNTPTAFTVGGFGRTTGTLNLVTDVPPGSNVIFRLPNIISGAQPLTVNHCDAWQSDIQNWLNTGGNANISLNGSILNCITSDYFDNTITGWVSNGCGNNMFRDVRFTGKFTDVNGVVYMNSWCSRVTLVDNQPPQWDMDPMDKTITCSAGSNATAELQMWLNNFGGAWVGACAGDLTKTNNFSGTLVCNTPRVVTFTATDHCGRSSTRSATVTLVDKTAPTLSGVPANTTLTCYGGFGAAPTVTATDNCGTATVTSSMRMENISSVLSGSQEVPPVMTLARGNLTATLNGTSLTLNGSYTGLTTPVTVAQLHIGAFGSNGPVAIDLIPGAMSAGATSGTINGTVTLSAAQITSLMAGDMYINISTSTFPGGEIRGQLGGCARVIRTWTATDACGNTTSASSTISVNDAVAPTITNVPANTTITCPATPTFTRPTFSDNCTAVASSFVDVTTGGPCPAGYSVVRTWTATDMCGNTSTATSRITVTSSTPPSTVTISCPANITVTAAAGATSAVVNWAAPTATTTCTTGTVTITRTSGPANGSAFPIGTTQVCFLATDACGSSASCCFNVVVNPPTTSTSVVNISCPANISVTATTGATSAVVTWPMPTATTNCPTSGVTMTQISGPANGSASPVGTTQVCFRATDACGSSASCCFNVVVTGSTVNPPSSTASINCPAPITMTAPAGASGMVVNFTAPLGSTTCTLTGTLNVVQISGPAPGSVFPIGTTQVCYRVTDACGGTASCCFNVTVNGSNPGGSALTLSVPPSSNITCGQPLNWPTAVPTTTCPLGGAQVTTSDASTGTSCTGITYTRTYRATDACGNVAVATHTIFQAPDNIPPVWTSLPPQDQMINCGQPINIGQATASDCSPNVTITNTVTNNGATSCNTINGITYGYDLYVNWVARDACGNTATATTNIWVLPTTNIAFLSKPTDKSMACSDQMVFEQPMPKSFIADIVHIDFVDDYDLDACGSGTVTRTWTATDAVGNTCQAQQIMTILPDTQKPSITLPLSYTSVDCADNLPTVTPIIDDNCTFKSDLVVTTIDKQIGQMIERTYVVTDACGNVNAAILMIELTDHQPPVFAAMQTEKIISCSEAVQFDTPTATDACNVKSLTYTDQVQQGSCATTHTRLWTATDPAGNMSQMQQRIIVVDKEAPKFTSQPQAKTVACASEVVFDVVSANDLCNLAIVYHNDLQTTPICGNSGYKVTRTWTANDGCNNLAQISQVITVAEDITAPTILTVLPAQVDITTAQAQSWQPAQLSVTDNCSNTSINVTHVKTVIDNCTFDVTYNVIDACGNTAQAKQQFRITDGACAPLSTGFIANSEFQIYPNPATNQLFLDLSQDFSLNNLRVEVIGINGSRYIANSVTSSNTTLDLSSLQSGNYFLRLTNEKGSATVKFVKIAR